MLESGKDKKKQGYWTVSHGGHNDALMQAKRACVLALVSGTRAQSSRSPATAGRLGPARDSLKSSGQPGP